MKSWDFEESLWSSQGLGSPNRAFFFWFVMGKECVEERDPWLNHIVFLNNFDKEIYTVHETYYTLQQPSGPWNKETKNTTFPRIFTQNQSSQKSQIDISKIDYFISFSLTRWPYSKSWKSPSFNLFYCFDGFDSSSVHFLWPFNNVSNFAILIVLHFTVQFVIWDFE